MSHRAPSVARRSRLALALATVTALASCGGIEPPPAPPPASLIPAYAGPAEPCPAPGGAKPEAEAPASSASFAALRDRILDQWLKDEPERGRNLGLHEFDGKIADYSAAAIEARIARVERERAELAAVDKAPLSPDEALDLALMLKRTELFLFEQKELVEWRRRPQFYDELFGVLSYIERDYAPIEERAQKLLAHEQAALAQVAHIRENLVSPMPGPVLETAVKIYLGYAEYLRGDVQRQLKGVGSPAFQEELARTNEKLAVEADKIAAHLKGVELPKGDNSHVLGAERYRKLLLAQEGLTVSLAEFKKMGEENLAINKKAYEAVARKTKLVRPKPEALFDEAARIMSAARRFLVDKKIVSIPSEDRAVPRETPPFMRWNAAFLNAPGPFEAKTVDAFYYISRPDPTWSRKEQDEYIPPFGTLLATTVHETYPGHFVHHLWITRAPSRAQKMLGSYSFTEGWAHYGEQMMIEEGFGAEDPQNLLGQLSDALLRNCRFVVSVGIHTEKMTLAAAERRFIDDCHQDKATAHQQAIRGTFDPGYFAYTLGKIQILALREEAKKLLGPKFSLQRFHDALLTHGASPVPLIRERVLHDLAEGAK
jgi:uncharacterized protein (DUF885 family)